MSQTRVKRSYDVFASSSSSSPSSSSSASTSHYFPAHPSTFDSPFESAHKRSRLPTMTSVRQSSEEDSAMQQLSPTSPQAAPTSHASITSDALRLSSQPAAPVGSTAAGRAVGSYRHPSPFVSRTSFDVPGFVETFPVKRKRPHSSMDDGSGAANAPPSEQANTDNEVQLPPSSSSPARASSAAAGAVPPSPPAMYSLDAVKRIVSAALALQEERLREEFERILNDLLREQFENFDRFNKDYVSRQISKHELSYLS